MRLLSLVLLCAACSNAPFMTAPHTPLPIVSGHDKVVIAKPQLVTITFPGYEFTDKVQAFNDFIGGSDWLRSVGAEYGVGPAMQLAKYVWPTAAPASLTDQDLRKLIVAQITAGALPTPMPADNTLVFVLYVPSSTILDATAFGAGVLCSKLQAHSAGGLYTAGYHGDLRAPDGTLTPYVVIGDCGNGQDEITAITSRELIGAFTNPYEVNNSGYLFETDATDPWIVNLNNGELGYLCARETPVDESGWKLNRVWSNAAAMASTQPCVPVPAGDVYYNVSASPATVVTAARGDTLSFTITGWSTAPTDDWILLMEKPEGTDLTIASMNPVLSVTKIDNAQTATLTLSVPSSAESAQLGGVNILSGPSQHVWPVGFTVK